MISGDPPGSGRPRANSSSNRGSKVEALRQHSSDPVPDDELQFHPFQLIEIDVTAEGTFHGADPGHHDSDSSSRVTEPGAAIETASSSSG